MKQNPKEKALRDNLEAGKLAKEGFLGDDPRPVDEIVATDLAELGALNLTQQQVAGRMRELTKKGLEGMGGPVEFGGYTLVVEDYMGWMGCPFRDHRRAAKRITRATAAKGGRQMVWSDMSTHLIEHHGFFQGLGSPYRLEPVELADFLGLTGPL